MIRRLFRNPLTHLVLAVLVVGLVQLFFVKIFAVPSASMESTLDIGDRLVVNRTAYWTSSPQPGDIVVFAAGSGWPSNIQPSPTWKKVLKGAAGALGYGSGNEHYLVKRVIGTAGDHVGCCNQQGQVLVNGDPLNEPYIYQDYPFVPGKLDCETAQVSMRCFPTVTVPAGKLLMLGDHRSDSNDSVYACRGRGVGTDPQGCAKWASADHVAGRVVSIAWPLNRLGGVH